MNVNYVLSEHGLIYMSWTRLNIICALLVADHMIEMTSTTIRRRLHLMLLHVLVACTMCRLWKNTNLKGIFGCIVFSKYVWLEFSSYSSSFFYQLLCNMHVSIVQKNNSQMLDWLWTSHLSIFTYILVRGSKSQDPRSSSKSLRRLPTNTLIISYMTKIEK